MQSARNKLLKCLGALKETASEGVGSAVNSKLLLEGSLVSFFKEALGKKESGRRPAQP